MSQVIAALISLVFAGAAAAQSFQVVPTPNPSAERNLLRGVSGTSDHDVWVVGDAQSDGIDRHILYHWNGTAWAAASAPFLNEQSHQLFGVSMLTPSLGWAAGLYSIYGWASGYVERWDGSAWTLVHDQPGEPLFAVWAVAPDDVWAVGTTSDPRPNPALALHWNGSGWQRIDPPLVADRNHTLEAVHASAADNVWAAGYSRTSSGIRRAYVVRWDGGAWHHMGIETNTLTAVAVLTFAPDDTWVALDLGDIWHWDGGGWTPFPLGLGSFAGRAPDDIYGFGAHEVHHWDGAAWTLVQTLPDVRYPAFRNAAQALPDGSVWAAGRVIDPGEIFRTLAVHQAGKGAPTGVGPGRVAAAPVTVGAYPNPFNPRTSLRLELAAASRVTLTVHDLAGRRVRTLLEGASLPAGSHDVVWDGQDAAGRPLPSGAYFARAAAGAGARTAKLLLVR